MHILIAGGTGFIGQALTKHFIQQKHQVSILGRSEAKIQQCFGDQVNALSWEVAGPKMLDCLSGVHLLINLTGANIGDQRWTDSRLAEITESRIEITEYLAKLCAELGQQSPVWFNASAIGIYDHAVEEHEQADENTPIKMTDKIGILDGIAKSWEQACQPAIDNGVRVVKLRFGVVLGKGGALNKMLPFFKLGLGGPVGSGDQAFPWISLHDVIRAIDFIYQHNAIDGPVNLVAPQQNNQKELAKALGLAISRPSFWPTPGCMIRLIYGQMGQDLLLRGTHVKPSLLLENKFIFEHANLHTALNSIYNEGDHDSP